MTQKKLIETQKIPVNVRIGSELVKKMEELGKNKTDIVTAALELYFSYDACAEESCRAQLNECMAQLSVLQAENAELRASKETIMQMYNNTREDNNTHVIQMQYLINQRDAFVKQIEEKSKRSFIDRLLRRK
jgi:cell division protein FtsB